MENVDGNFYFKVDANVNVKGLRKTSMSTFVVSCEIIVGACLNDYVNPFAAREFVPLMQSLQRRVSQRDSAIPKRSFCSALVLMSVHEESEGQQVVL